MVFSKSFGYALRGVLFIALSNDTSRNVQLEEIADKLSLPRFFLGKVLRLLVKNGVLNSIKGPHGGFSVNEKTMQTTLLQLIELTGETESFDACVLHMGKCDAAHPCPLHFQAVLLKVQWHDLVNRTCVGDLLKKGQEEFIKNIATV